VFDDWDGVVDECPTTPGTAAFHGCPAAISVKFNRHTVQAGTRPGSSKVGVSGATVAVFDKSPGSCAATTGISPKNFVDILAGCEPVTTKLTDAGSVLIGTVPGDYLLISQDPVTTEIAGVAASDLLTGQLLNKHIQVIVRADGSSVPARTRKKTGSELLIIEPEYITWSGTQELYPFIFESVGDWGVSVAVSPPDGFTSDYSSLDAQVTNEIEVIQFTITDVGSDWSPTEVTFTVQHAGRSEVIRSTIGVALTPALARAKGCRNPPNRPLHNPGRSCEAGGQ